MWRSLVLGVVVVSISTVAAAQSSFLAFDPAPETGTMVAAASESEVQPNPVIGFIELLFGEPLRQSQRESRQWFGAPPQESLREEQDGRMSYANASPDD